MAKRRPFVVNRDELPTDVTHLEEIDPDEVRRINNRFIREHGEEFPLLAGLLTARVVDEEDES